MSDRNPKTNRMSIYEKCREQGHEHIHNVCPTIMRYVFAVIFVQDSWLYQNELTDVTARRSSAANKRAGEY